MLFLLGSLLAASNILIYPHDLPPGGFGDRAANLLMIYNIKEALKSDSKIYLYLNGIELDWKKFSILLGLKFEKNKEYPIKRDPVTLSFIVDQNNSDFIIITGLELVEKNTYDISFCFSYGERLPRNKKIFDNSTENDKLIVNEHTLNYFLEIKDSNKIPFFVFTELIPINKFLINWEILNPSPKNYLYVSQSSFIPRDLNDDNLKNIFLPDEVDKKILVSYFHTRFLYESIHLFHGQQSLQDTDINTALYLISVYESMNLNEKYSWFHNSNFKSVQELQRFFVWHELIFLNQGYTKEKIRKFLNFLNSVNLTLVNKDLNLLQFAALFKIADFPIGSTGDVSLSLALRYGKYKPIYEVKRWKEEFFKDFFDSFQISSLNLLRNPNINLIKDEQGSILVKNDYMKGIHSPTFTDLVVKCIHNITKELKE